MYCEGNGQWSYFTSEVPEEGDDYFSYYMEYDDTYYHVYCTDPLQNECVFQYDDYYDAGTVYYVDGEVYYWEIYAMPGEEEYNGKHVHAALDGSSYSVYSFSEPEGSAFTYYETPEFASTYDYATGEYTEWLQDFYGEAEAENLNWYATAYVSDDSDSIDDFSASMGTENIELTAVYDAFDDLIVTVTTEKDAFYAQWTVGNEEDAIVEYGDEFDSGVSFDDFTQQSETWYTYYDIDGNKFEVHNYVGQNDVMGNLYISEIDGEVIEFYYQFDAELHNDKSDVQAIGVDDFTAYSVSIDYTNEHYFEAAGYSAYQLLADDGVSMYYISEFSGEDGTYRQTETNADDCITYYRSADGYFESYYSWYTQTYTTIYNDVYINYISDDGMSGNYYYMSANGVYFMYGSWFNSFEGEFSLYESDSYGFDMYSF